MLFSAASPLCPLLALIGSVLKSKLDAYKMLHIFRRPIPTTSESIGSLSAILRIVAILSIATNGGIIFFTRNSGVYTNLQSFEVASFSFLVFQYSMCLGVCLCMYFVSGRPRSVRLHLARQWFVLSRLNQFKTSESYFASGINDVNSIQNNLVLILCSQ